jgi:hypothetical protein
MQTEAKVEPPEKTFFFERHDGSIISVKEPEAWRIVTGRNQAYLRYPIPKIIGVSDGTTFRNAVLEAQELAKTDLEAAKARIRKGYDDELAAARGHVESPRNFDVVDKTGQPTRI